MSRSLAEGFLSALRALPLARDVEIPASFQATIQPSCRLISAAFMGLITQVYSNEVRP